MLLPGKVCKKVPPQGKGLISHKDMWQWSKAFSCRDEIFQRLAKSRVCQGSTIPVTPIATNIDDQEPHLNMCPCSCERGTQYLRESGWLHACHRWSPSSLGSSTTERNPQRCHYSPARLASEGHPRQLPISPVGKTGPAHGACNHTVTELNHFEWVTGGQVPANFERLPSFYATSFTLLSIVSSC